MSTKGLTKLRVVVASYVLATMLLPAHAQFGWPPPPCWGVPGYSNQTETTLTDLDGDGQPDVQLDNSSWMTVSLDCAMERETSAYLNPLGATRLLLPTQSTVSPVLAIGAPLNSTPPAGWTWQRSSVLLEQRLYGGTYWVGEQLRTNSGVLTVAGSTVQYLGCQVEGRLGRRLGWISVRRESEGKVLVVDFGIQSNANQAITVGEKPPKPPPSEIVETSEGIDLEGDGVMDAFLVRREAAEGVAGSRPVSVRIENAPALAILCEPTPLGLPEEASGASLPPRWILTRNPLPPLFWKPVTNAPVVLERRLAGGGDLIATGPSSRGGLTSLGLLKTYPRVVMLPEGTSNTVFAVVRLKEDGHLDRMFRTTGVGVAVPPPGEDEPETPRVAQVLYDIDRDGMADFESHFESAGTSRAGYNRVVVGGLGIHRLLLPCPPRSSSEGFEPGTLLYATNNAGLFCPDYGSILVENREWEIELNGFLNMKYYQILPGELLGFRLETPEGTRPGWFRLGAPQQFLTEFGMGAPQGTIRMGKTATDRHLRATYRAGRCVLEHTYFVTEHPLQSSATASGGWQPLVSNQLEQASVTGESWPGGWYVRRIEFTPAQGTRFFRIQP